MDVWPKWHENKPFALGLLVLVAFLIMFLWVKVDYTQRLAARVGEADVYEHTITVEGEGKVSGVPNIATVTFGIDTKGVTVAEAQKKNSETVNALLKKLKDTGVPEEDIQTASYSSYENTEWDQTTQRYTSRGWIVSQQLTVKVRDLEKISGVLELAGQSGVTNISGPNLTLDDPEKLKAEARKEAIAEAMKNAKELEKRLGVRLERVVGYSEWTDSGSPQPYYAKEAGMGGSAAPDIAPGSVEMKLHASITYKLVE